MIALTISLKFSVKTIKMVVILFSLSPWCDIKTISPGLTGLHHIHSTSGCILWTHVGAMTSST